MKARSLRLKDHAITVVGEELVIVIELSPTKGMSLEMYSLCAPIVIGHYTNSGSSTKHRFIKLYGLAWHPWAVLGCCMASKVVDDPSVRLGNGNYGRISRRTGLTKQHVSRVLRGLREPTLDVAALIAREAGVTLDELYEHTMKFRKDTSHRRSVA